MVVEEVIEVGGGLMSEGKDFGLDALRNGECGEDAGDVFIGLGWNMESTKKIMKCAENLLPHWERVQLSQLQLDFLFLQQVIRHGRGWLLRSA